MATLGKRVPLQIIPGVNPLEDSTPLDTVLFTAGDKIRFQEGKLRKIGGWQRIFSPNFQRIYGAARNIFTTYDNNGDPITLIGTSYGLYAYQFGVFYNITPLQSTSTAIPNSLSTQYITGSYGITTTIGSSIVTLNIPNYFASGQFITVSGVTGTINGIPASAFNGTFLLTYVNNSQVQIAVASMATSSGEVFTDFTWGASYLYVYDPGNGLSIGDRIKISGAGAVDGIPDTEINGETIVTNIVDDDTFVIGVTTVATSSVVDGGGAGTTIKCN